MDPAMPRRAFTLLELLVVISIIAAMAALLVPIISIARKASKDAKMHTQLGQIQAALELYKSVSGSYPEQINTTANLNTDPISSTFGITTAASPPPPKAVQLLSESDWRLVNITLKAMLQSVDPDTFHNTPSNPAAATPDTNDPGNYIVDPYGNRSLFKVIRYRPARYYPFGQGVTGTVPAIDSANPPNPNGYQLWSAGWDGKDEYGEKQWMMLKGDDVTNWSNN
jgi:prepilin-type N-terminal cleavage/methylation domain-containing protein